MNKELYQKLFVRMDGLGAIRKDLSLGCEIETCECNDGCCGIEEGVIGEKYGKCNGFKTSYIGAKFEINIMDVKGNPPVLSDCISAIKIGRKEWCIAQDTLWDTSKPYLHQQSDELGEKLFTLLK